MSKSTRPLRIELLESRDTPSAGALDPTFGNGGQISAAFTGNSPSEILAVVTQTDGKIVAVGTAKEANQDVALVRYNADGSLDTTFGVNGQVTTDFGASSQANAVTIQSDGKIVIAGHTAGGTNGDIVVARYNTDGSLDTTFGTGGEVITDTGSNSTHSYNDSANTVAELSSGKILVEATRVDSGTANTGTTFVLVRYNSDGSLDTTFGTKGVQQITTLTDADFVAGFSTATPLSNGQTLVVGTIKGGATDTGDFLVKRFNADGSLDTTFGNNGIAEVNIGTTSAGSLIPGVLPVGSVDNAYRAAVQPDGKIVVVGSSDSGSGPQFAVVRLNANGSLDTTFGTNGITVFGFPQTGDVALNASILPNGKIMVLGTSGRVTTLGNSNIAGTAGLAVAQLTADSTTTTPPPVTTPPVVTPPIVPVTEHLLAVASESGPAVVNVYDPTTGALKFTLHPYGNLFTGGVRVATADVNGDGVDDIITAAGVGGGPHVEVFNGKNGQLMLSFMAYNPNFTGGVYVTAADLYGDGRTEIITGAGQGGGPQVNVFDGMTGALDAEFMAYSTNFSGGVRVAAGDVDGTGAMDIVTGAGPGGGPHVKIFNSVGQELPGGFMAFNPTYTGGVNVAVGNLEGNNLPADIIVSQSGQTTSAHVRVYTGGEYLLREDLVPYAPLPTYNNPGIQLTDNVSVAAVDMDGDGIADLVVSGGPHRASVVESFKGTTLALIGQFTAFSPSQTGGIVVG